MILIYSEQKSPRLIYATKLVFRWVLKQKFPCEFTQDQAVFHQYQGRKINYSNTDLGEGVHVPCTGFLYETGVREIEPKIGHDQGDPYLFPMSGSADFAYDIFAAVFYMVSRYEEYQQFTPDEHGRFKAEDSFAFRHEFLHRPVVHYWCNDMKSRLMEKYPDFHFPRKKYRYVSTIDIDNGYAYLGRGLGRTLGGYGKALISGKLSSIIERTKVLVGQKRDPFDQYNYQKKLARKLGVPMRYFVLSAQKSTHDGGINPNSTAYFDLVRRLRKFAKVGLHPSYQSHEDPEILKEEHRNLQRALGKKPVSARFHFLKMDMPHTYQLLIKLGIKRDFSMGYASQPGFRAGIAEPFPFYDLVEEKETKLIIRPFQIMDATFMYYWKTNPEESLIVIKRMIDEVRQVNGLMITIWHDKYLSSWPEYREWRHTYTEMLKYAAA